jgi:hypothetical protein
MWNFYEIIFKLSLHPSKPSGDSRHSCGLASKPCNSNSECVDYGHCNQNLGVCECNPSYYANFEGNDAVSIRKLKCLKLLNDYIQK